MPSTATVPTSPSSVSSRLLDYLFTGRLARVQRIARCLAYLNLRNRPSAEYLPPEILCYIFQYAAHASDEADPFVTPLVVSHVCTRWRRIALNDAGLWTCVTLTNPFTSLQALRASTWLSRSKQHSLNLLLDFRDASWDWDEDSHSFGSEDMQRVLDLILPHAHRWRRFELLSDTWSPIHTFLERAQHIQSAPMLEELSLSRCNAYFAANGVAFSPLELRSHIPIFCGAALSKLRVVSLAGVHIDWTSTALRGLSELEIKYHASDVMPSFEQFKDMLVGCPDLLKLTLLGWGPRSPLPSKRTCAPEMSSRVNITEPPIILPKVTHFSIGFVDIEYTIQLLSTLSLPSLEYLSMEDVSRTINPMEIQDATFLMEWLSRDPVMDVSMIPPLPLSLAKIATLHLNGISSTTSSMSSFFVQCSSLRSLHLIQTDTTPLSALHPLVSRDVASGVAVTPCPDLAELVLDSPDFDALTNLATNRNDAGCPSLKRVFVEMSDEDDDDCCINDITRAVFDAAGIKLLAFSS